MKSWCEWFWWLLKKEYARTRNSIKKDDKKDEKRGVAYVWREISLELFSFEKEMNES